MKIHKIDNSFQIYQGNCLDILPKLDYEFDFVFADPPYFLSNNGLSIQNGQIVSVNKGEWDKGLKAKEIDEFNYTWLKLIKEKLSQNGSICISGTYHNIFSIGRMLQDLDYKILNIITWQKTNPPPNFSCRYLTHSTEQIIWARKSEKYKHIFNYELMKKINDNKQMKDVWQFNAIAPWEKINGKHPTQKPLALLIRLLAMASNLDSIILDPFSGSSSTGIAANLLNRKFIGIEQEKEYIEISLKRKKELMINSKEIRKKIKDFKTILKQCEKTLTF